jgi:hypothetical protein
MMHSMNMSKFAYGVDYHLTTYKPQQVRMQRVMCIQLCIVHLVMINTNIRYLSTTTQVAVWSIDRFNARKPNKSTDAQRSLPAGSHSTADTALLLTQINRDKQMTTSIISLAIDGSWIGYANAMGLVFQEPFTPEHRQIVTMGDLRMALKQMTLADRLAALYFLTGYTRDVLYSQVLWGVSHQDAVEDYVMEMLGASFSTSRSDMKPGHKTCVG